MHLHVLYELFRATMVTQQAWPIVLLAPLSLLEGLILNGSLSHFQVGFLGDIDIRLERTVVLDFSHKKSFRLVDLIPLLLL